MTWKSKLIITASAALVLALSALARNASAAQTGASGDTRTDHANTGRRLVEDLGKY